MSSFLVNHGAYDEANMNWGAAVQRVGQILSNLGQALVNTNRATQGLAAPIYERDQQEWERKYQSMLDTLAAGQKASDNVHQIYRDGDAQGARAML